MKFRPVIREIVSTTTGSSTSSKSRETSSSCERSGGAAGLSWAAPGRVATSAISRAGSRRRATKAPFGLDRGGTLFLLHEVVRVGRHVDGRVAAESGDVDGLRRGELVEDGARRLGTVDHDSVHLHDDVAVLEPCALEEAVRLDGVDLHAQHLALDIVGHDPGLGQEAGEALAVVSRERLESIVHAIRSGGPPARARRRAGGRPGPDGLALVERQLLAAPGVVEDHAGALDRLDPDPTVSLETIAHADHHVIARLLVLDRRSGAPEVRRGRRP